MITLVDRPPVQMPTIETLEAAFADARARRKWAVVPEYQGKHGHPMLVGRELIEAFLRAPETGNARDVEHAHESEIEYIPVDDPLVALNINTPEQYAALHPPNLLAVPPKLLTTS
jgi:molybdenum cofactor cytidylyltransferase